MKKLLPILIAILILTGCAPSPTQPQGDVYYTFNDSTGAAVTLERKPQTVAVLFSSYAEIWKLAGGRVCVTVGESVDRGFADASAILVDAGAGKTIDHELLLSSQPDLIIASADIPAQVDACKIMTEAGIPSALFRVDTFGQYLSMLKICTTITGDTTAYQTYGLDIKAQIDTLMTRIAEAELPRRNYLFIRAGSQYSSTKAKRAPDNFVCIMLDELGAHNIADDADILLDGLSLEEILLKNPDQIYLTAMGNQQAAVSYIGELFTQEGWQDLQAVKTGCYAFLPKEMFHFKPNAKWAEAYKLLAQYLYPELSIHG